MTALRVKTKRNVRMSMKKISSVIAPRIGRVKLAKKKVYKTFNFISLKLVLALSGFRFFSSMHFYF